MDNKMVQFPVRGRGQTEMQRSHGGMGLSRAGLSRGLFTCHHMSAQQAGYY